MRALRWGFASTAMLLVLVGAIAFGGWYSAASEWHPSGDGREAQVEINLWPPSFGWRERLIQQ